MRLLVVLALAGCSTVGVAPADLAPADAGACVEDAARCFVVDELGVTHGCTSGGMGPGDRDDGGGLPPAGPPDAAADLRELPFAAPCLSNVQCSSSLCYDYRVKGQFCTGLCGCDRDCPDASPGCSGQGVCRVAN